MLNDAEEFKDLYNAFVVSTHTKEGWTIGIQVPYR